MEKICRLQSMGLQRVGYDWGAYTFCVCYNKLANSDRMQSTGEGNGKPLQYSSLENPMNTMKRQNDRILEDELPRQVGAQYSTGEQWRRNEEMEPKQNQHPVVDVTGDGSKG